MQLISSLVKIAATQGFDVLNRGLFGKNNSHPLRLANEQPTAGTQAWKNVSNESLRKKSTCWYKLNMKRLNKGFNIIKRHLNNFICQVLNFLLELSVLFYELVAGGLRLLQLVL